MKLVSLIVGLIFCISIIFLPTTQSLLTSNPTIATGLIAILSASTAGFISAISNHLQASSAKDLLLAELDYRKEETLRKRINDIIDEKHGVIIAGANVMAEQFESLYHSVSAIIRAYETSLPYDQLKELVSFPYEAYGQVAMVRAEVKSLNDEALNHSWENLAQCHSTLTMVHSKLAEAVTEMNNNPESAQSKFNEYANQHACGILRNRFVDEGGGFRSRLAGLRIQASKESTTPSIKKTVRQ